MLAAMDANHYSDLNSKIKGILKRDSYCTYLQHMGYFVVIFLGHCAPVT